ncbi:MAG TPA: CYTH domain-containing protein [Candidatus Paceibacterota bacterium]
MEELELTYLAKELPKNLSSSPSKEMLDIYVPSTSTHPGLRIRRRGDVFEITKKRPVSDGDASRQFEETIVLTKEEYDELSFVKGKRIAKTRYYYKEGDTDFEVDVFGGGLTGLVLVDVEFSSIKKKNVFSIPSFCLADVTQEHFVAGGMLCGKTYKDIQNDLNRFGYKKLSLS